MVGNFALVTGRKVMETSLGKYDSLAVIATTADVEVDLKRKISARVSCLGDQPRRRRLADTEKCPKR